ncbi:MAG TPA: UDP-3-O-(3-hydroxymyristoyl)glucosamine N-acyltransferase [Opitutaceae bacterium]|nr:UDP-3-O-(3-hydroxymyristoyl)glucosamine N-acyltransferase [Opitutaceae bacterium]
MQVSLTPDEIAAIVQPKASRGATTDTIHAISALEGAGPGDLTFLGNAKYKPQVAGTRASIVLLPLDYDGQPAPNQLFLLMDRPSAALASLCTRFEQALWPKPAPGIHPTACIAPGARVAASATVGPLCVIEMGAVVGERTHLQAQVFVGRGASIGDDCWLKPGVTISAECVLHHRIHLHPGVVVGADGFGYEFSQGRHEKVPQVGIVVIESDVEIGANSTLDRARFSRTVVGEGTKIDNLVQIGHNVVIGRHCILCAQTGISGSATLEDYVVLGGQVGVAGHITMGRGSKAGGQSGVSANISPGVSVNGTVAIPYMLERRIQVLRGRLPDLFKRVEAIEAQLKKSSAR